jgi:hypothetical protein
MVNRQNYASSSQSFEKYNSIYTAWGMVIIFLVIFILSIINQYGRVALTVQLLYIPILISVIIFGIKGGMATAIFAGISVRPFIMLYALSTINATASWVTQFLMFLVSVGLFGIMMNYYKNIKELEKAMPYENRHTGSANTLMINLNNIINAIKYLSISFTTFEYKNLNFINSNINFISGKKSFELTIINNYDSDISFEEFNERIVSKQLSA